MILSNNLEDLKYFIQKIPDGGIIDSPITTVFQTKFQKEGTISRLKGITNDPTGVIADSDLIFFTDSQNQRIMKINQETNMMDVVAIANVSSRPEAIAMTSTGNFVISDWPSDLIMEVENVNGVAEIKEKFDVSGLFEDPKNISLDRNTGNIYVTDKQNGTITKLTDFDVFGFPIDIIAGPSNEIFITEPGQNRILQFNSEGKFVNEVGSNLMGNDALVLPLGLDIDGSTNLYVAESGNDRISKFDSNLDLVAHFGPRDSGDSLLDSPTGVAVNGTDIFVSESSKNRIQKFNQNDASFGFFENYNINSTLFRIPFNGAVTVDVTTPGKVNFTNTPSGATVTWH